MACYRVETVDTATGQEGAHRVEAQSPEAARLKVESGSLRVARVVEERTVPPGFAVQDWFAGPLCTTIGLWGAGVLLGLVMLVINPSPWWAAPDTDPTPVEIVAGLAGLGVAIPMIVSWAILLYRWWQVIPPEHRSTTPGRAVGFSFIPLFHLYWTFVAYAGLAKGLNAALSARGIHVRASEGLAIALSVVYVVSFALCWVPFVIDALGLATYVLYVLFALNVTAAARALSA